MPDPSVWIVLDDNAIRLVIAQTIALLVVCWIVCWRITG